MLSVADPSGKTRLLAAMCDTCIFHPGNRMHLAPGRLADLVADTRKDGGFIVCHTTLPGPWQQAAPAVCRGFHDRYRHPAEARAESSRYPLSCRVRPSDPLFPRESRNRADPSPSPCAALQIIARLWGFIEVALPSKAETS
jgi:hypothetical protein